MVEKNVHILFQRLTLITQYFYRKIVRKFKKKFKKLYKNNQSVGTVNILNSINSHSFF